MALREFKVQSDAHTWSLLVSTTRTRTHRRLPRCPTTCGRIHYPSAVVDGMVFVSSQYRPPAAAAASGIPDDAWDGCLEQPRPSWFFFNY